MRNIVFEATLHWVEDNIYRNPSVEELVSHVGYSRRFIYSVFQEFTGQPIGYYIRMRRMTLAAGKLKVTRQSIAAIAHRFHYDSHQTFSREFKKTFGVSPRAYRNNPLWDTTLLHHKITTAFQSLAPPVLVTLAEQGFAGHRFNYEVLPQDNRRPEKIASKQQLDRYRLATDDDIYILSRFHSGADNQQMIAVEAFIGVKSPHMACAVAHTVAAAGRYLRFSFTGSWQEYACLSNYIYINVLPRYGLCRRQGDDIECFSKESRQCAQTGQDLYTLTYYVPVMNL